MDKMLKGVLEARFRTNIKILIWSTLGTEIIISLLAFLMKKGWVYSFINNYGLFLLITCIFISGIGLYSCLKILAKIIKSSRYEIFISFLLAIILTIFLNQNFVLGNRINYKEYLVYIKKFAYNTLSDPLYWKILLLSIVILLVILVTIIAFIKYILKKKSSPLFLNDNILEDEDEDALQLKDDAHNFAEQVINNLSSDSIVFGLDAPWGSGKSSYLKFCENYWIEKYKEEVVIFRFDPLNFDIERNLFESFITEFTKVLKKKYFVPEITRSLKSYSHIISDVKFSIPGIEATLLNNNTSTSEAFNSLKDGLFAFQKKIIIIIDDLDRLPLEEIKIILNIVKSSFVLPNVTYILCYDTRNIDTFNSNLHKYGSVTEFAGSNGDKVLSIEAKSRGSEKFDHSKIVEYFEKIVNIKKSIFLDRKDLKSFLIKNLDKILIDKVKTDNRKLDKIIGSFSQLFSAEKFHQYQPYLGDIRKIKRFLNITLLLDAFKVDPSEMDYDEKDLINLLLIYINFPYIFNKIYATETDGGKGYFSLTLNHTKEGGRYINSEFYKGYITDKSEEEKFLLQDIFSDEKFKEQSIDNIDKKIKANSAAFNGGVWDEGRNLENYLNLIVRRQHPEIIDQYNFHLTNAEDFIEGRKEISEILAHPLYSVEKGEKPRTLFFNTLLNNIEKIEYQYAKKLIDYFINSLGEYSDIDNTDLETGLRTTNIFNLIKVLDRKGWHDDKNKSRNNTQKFISEIADRIFGENAYKQQGILAELSAERRGVLGIYDLLIFRHSCNQTGGSTFYNVYRALAYHTDPNAKTDGLIIELAKNEMREISQICFEVFRSRYIMSKLNIFDVISNLNLDDLARLYRDYTLNKATQSGLDLESIINRTKLRITSFLVYQLASRKAESGMGCGYYDTKGKADSGEISELMNNYIFDVCFNPELEQKNYEYFIDYLLTHYSTTLGSEGFEYIPTLNGFTEVLRKNRLIDYWHTNKDAIQVYFSDKNKIIDALNYPISYKEDLPKVYKILDEELESRNQSLNIPGLLGKNTEEIKKELGQPENDSDPTPEQVELGVTKWNKSFKKNNTNLLVTYNPITKKVIDFFIEAEDPSGTTSEIESLKRKAYVEDNERDYSIEPVASLKNPNSFTGIKIIPKK